MESCYVPNNPNFASDQWTPPSPTSPSDCHQIRATKGSQPHQSAPFNPAADHPLCHPVQAAAQQAHLTSLSTLPPVQELLGPCPSPADGTTSKDRDPFSGYSLTALDFEPLPGFLTLNPCSSYKDRQHQDMSDPLSKSHNVSYSSLYQGHGSPSQPAPQSTLGPLSPFSAAVAAATHSSAMSATNQCSLNSPTSHNSLSYSFHAPSGKMTSNGYSTVSDPTTSSGYGGNFNHCHVPSVGASVATGIFPSMSVNVSMNMTMGMGMGMSYGLEPSAPLQWNTSAPIHVPVAVQQNSANNTSASPYAMNSVSQGLLSPIQVSYNSNLYPTSFTPSSGGYSLPDWRPSDGNLYELKDLKESAPASTSPFKPSVTSVSATYGTKSLSSSKAPSSAAQYAASYGAPAENGYSAPSHPPSPSYAAKKRSLVANGTAHRQSFASSSSTTALVEYGESSELPSCGSSSSHQSNPISSTKANLCRVCGKTYARPSTLKTHMRTHSGERPYRCTDCHKSFSQAANLTAHVRTHSGEKPFRCQICDRRFSQSSSVTTHMRTHSGERPYRCRMCKKAFSDSSTLTKHMRIHSGEKPYQCKLCLLRFSQSGNLNRHMRVHSATS